MLGFDDDAHAIVGVDMGATHIAVAVTDLRSQVKAWRSKIFDVREDPEGAMSLMRGLIDGALIEASIDRERLVGIGVSVPSPVSPSTQRSCPRSSCRSGRT